MCGSAGMCATFTGSISRRVSHRRNRQSTSGANRARVDHGSRVPPLVQAGGRTRGCVRLNTCQATPGLA